MRWLLAGALLIAMSASAGADCAWVLWQEVRKGTYDEPNPKSSWTLQSAYPTFQKCDARAQELVLEAQGSFLSQMVFGATGKVVDTTEGFYKIIFQPELPKSGDSNAIQEWRSQGRATHGSQIFQCLPDSINPAVERQREEKASRKKR